MASEFGKYLLQRKLAEGGMAEVFLAKQAGLEGFEKPVVVKRILPHLTSDPKFVEMFVNEARVAARLSHPSIVQIFELGKVEDQYFIAMEYIHGEDLRGIAQMADRRRDRPSMALVCRVIADMLGALHYAHTRAGADGRPLGLVHRDISPQNVLVTYEGNVKLVDFGIAKATESAQNQQTQAGLLKGKYAYMSPEQCRSKKIDARSDIFATGILLWELVTWRRLFRRDSDLATLVAVAEDPIPALKTMRPDVPDELDAIVRRALARPLAERYPSAQAMRADLEALIRRYAWEADSIAVSRYMRELFSEKLQAQDEAVRAAGVGSLEDLLAAVDDNADAAWIDPVSQTGRTPASMPLPVDGAQAPPPPEPAPPEVYSPPPAPAPMYIAPVPGPRPDGLSPWDSSTLRNAVGQAMPQDPLGKTGSMSALGGSRLKRALVVGGTTVLLAGAVLTAVLWPGTQSDPTAQSSESATVHVKLDEEAQIFLDGDRQPPAREADLTVSAKRPHEIRIRFGETERKVEVPPLDAGATHRVELKLKPQLQ